MISGPASLLHPTAEARVTGYWPRTVGVGADAGGAMKLLGVMHQAHLPDTSQGVLAWFLLMSHLVSALQHRRCQPTSPSCTSFREEGRGRAVEAAGGRARWGVHGKGRDVSIHS